MHANACPAGILHCAYTCYMAKTNHTPLMTRDNFLACCIIWSQFPSNRQSHVIVLASQGRRMWISLIQHCILLALQGNCGARPYTLPLSFPVDIITTTTVVQIISCTTLPISFTQCSKGNFKAIWKISIRRAFRASNFRWAATAPGTFCINAMLIEEKVSIVACCQHNRLVPRCQHSKPGCQLNDQLPAADTQLLAANPRLLGA